jgi:NAD(P)-dependent dehydrogenase (short-subunit alcohol dehydrogenase family)
MSVGPLKEQQEGKVSQDRRRAVVTGSASGLGRAIALALARQGWHILIADINREGMNETLAQVRAAGGTGEVFSCDVSRAEDVQAMAEHCFSSWKRVDLLVNNAGVASSGLVGDIPLEDWRWIMGINLWGMIHGCHYFIPGMKAQGGGGHIVNVSSAAGIACLPEMASYNVVKAGAISLSESMKTELSPFRIGVTVVCPTFFKTNLGSTLRYVDPFQKNFSEAAFQNGRLTAEQIADMTLKAVRKNRLYLVPQASGKLMWLMKRFSPGLFYGSMAFIMRRQFHEKLFLLLARMGLT